MSMFVGVFLWIATNILINPPRSETSSDIEVTVDAVPVDSEHRINSTREGSPSEEPVELQFSFRDMEDVSVDSEHHLKSPSSSSEAVHQVTSPVESVEERSPIPAEMMPHTVHNSNSSPLKLNVSVDSTTETPSQKSQDLQIPVGNVSQADLTSGDRISEPETSSSEEDEIDFIDVEEVATSSSPPNTTILLNSPQECLSNRDLQGEEADDSEYDLEEVAVIDQEEVSVDSQNVTDVSKTSFSEMLVGSGEEDDFELDDDFLRAEADRLERLAQQTSNEVIAEAQRLLLLFGLPFIVSPEEAEAQCCRLQQLGLVDVVASDDSDVWLFGARLVLRHLFGTPRGSFTASYSVEDIHRRLGLDRAQLLRIALLCGSDYTTGVPKIGPVKAMEILAEFAGKSSELPSGCISELTVKRHVSSVIEPLINFRTTVMNAEQMPSLSSKSSPSKFRWRCISLPNDFPNATVVEAYLSPNVDSSTSEFRWTEPQVSDLVRLEHGNHPLKSKEPDELLSSKRTARLSVSSQKLRYAAEFADILSKDDGTWLKTSSASSTKPSTPECSVSTASGHEICPHRRRRSHPERGVSKGSQRKRRRKQF
ncbi:nucleotide-excision repair, DNA incision, 3'-to lesion [Sparganum proliferum]